VTSVVMPHLQDVCPAAFSDGTAVSARADGQTVTRGGSVVQRAEGSLRGYT